MKPNSKQPMPPVDNPLLTNGKRGKAFEPIKSSWGQVASPGRIPFDARDADTVLRECLGWDNDA